MGRGNPLWVKGKSGNPSGRPKLSGTAHEQLKQARELARKYVPEAIAQLVLDMASEKAGDRIRAIELLLRWAFGEPAKLEPDAQPGDQALAQMPREDRIAFLEAALAHERGEEAKVVALPSLALLPPQKPA